MEILLVLVLSLDAFVASIAYGMNRIKIPFISIFVINMVCTSFLVLSIILGELIKYFLPSNITSMVSFLILIALGFYYLFQGFAKSLIGDEDLPQRRIKLKLFDFRLIIDIYVNKNEPIFNSPMKLDPKEALFLATALSLDSIAIGFSSGLGDVNIILIIILSLIFHFIAIWSGLFVGRILTEKTKLDLSWLTGIILIALGLLKLKIK